MPQAYVLKIVAMVMTVGVKYVAPLVTALVAAHFNPGQLGAMMVHPLGWGSGP